MKNEKAGRFRGCEIVDFNDGCFGMTASLLWPDGHKEKVKGSWAFTPGISWYRIAGYTETGFERGEWVVIGGYWQ